MSSSRSTGRTIGASCVLPPGIVGNDAVAHDVVQETFARALRAAETYRAEGPVAAWVWRILVNTARSSVSRREIPVETQDEGNVLSPDDERPDLGEWIASLPERQRLAIFLRYYADLDYRAIADVLEVETGTVSATLSAAHAALRRSLLEVRR